MEEEASIAQSLFHLSLVSNVVPVKKISSAMPAAALSLRRLPSLVAPAHRRTSRTSTPVVVVTRALFGKNRQSQAQEAVVEQLPPAPARRFSSRSNARRSSPHQLVAAPGSGSRALSLSQRYESAPPLARGLIGAAAALALFAVVKKILGGGR